VLDKPGAAPKDGAVRITDKHTEHLLRHGYVIVPDFLTPAELSAARENMLQYYPSAEELSATPQRYGAIAEEGDALQTEFPFASGGSASADDALNNISTHPEIISFVERLLGTSNVLLSQSAIWAKYAGAGSYEQGLHLDYQGNTLVVPRDDGDYRQVNMILYYTDVDETLGPTYVVSQEKTRDLPLWPTHRTRKKDPQLYKLEKPVLATAGTLLIFSMRTFHRASDITADFGARFSHHLVYRSGSHNFSGYHLWSQHGENPELQRFIAHATPRQREVLGFPPPGHAYWNEEALANVALRYPEMDMTPYYSKTSSALSRRDAEKKRKSC
jgi:ectoine hydroxylase-related dioxygenase (phytanoyl-CoA dioxygenase family)